MFLAIKLRLYRRTSPVTLVSWVCLTSSIIRPLRVCPSSLRPPASVPGSFVTLRPPVVGREERGTNDTKAGWTEDDRQRETEGSSPVTLRSRSLHLHCSRSPSTFLGHLSTSVAGGTPYSEPETLRNPPNPPNLHLIPPLSSPVLSLRSFTERSTEGMSGELGGLILFSPHIRSALVSLAPGGVRVAD